MFTGLFTALILTLFVFAMMDWLVPVAVGIGFITLTSATAFLVYAM